MPDQPGTEVPFRLVDVFCERPLAGNQLCVVPEPGSIDNATMQSLAREIGFSETTFVTAYDGDRYRCASSRPVRSSRSRAIRPSGRRS